MAVTYHSNDGSALEEESNITPILSNKKDDPPGLEHLDEVHQDNVLPRLLSQTDNILSPLSASSSSSSVS